MCEIKKCKCCGRELPVANYRKTRLGYMATCNECLRQRQIDGREKKRLVENYSNDIEKARIARLSDFTPRELMVELKKRGFEFTMKYTEVKTIDSRNL